MTFPGAWLFITSSIWFDLHVPNTAACAVMLAQPHPCVSSKHETVTRHESLVLTPCDLILQVIYASAPARSLSRASSSSSTSSSQAAVCAVWQAEAPGQYEFR